MKWYFINPETREEVYLSLEEWYAELAWDFRYKTNLCILQPIEKTDNEILNTLITLYDLDSKEAAYEIVKWIYYFHFNSDKSNTECYIPIQGE